MKAHIGVDNKTKLSDAVVAMAANLHDATTLPDLLHGKATRGRGGHAYRRQPAAIRKHAVDARAFTNRRYRSRGVVDDAEKARSRT